MPVGGLCSFCAVFWAQARWAIPTCGLACSGRSLEGSLSLPSQADPCVPRQSFPAVLGSDIELDADARSGLRTGSLK